MNLISTFMPKFLEQAEAIKDELDEPRGRKTQGPRRFRFITAGQQRRAAVRGAKTAQRKTNVRFRKRWMDNQRAVGVLRGQLQVVGAIPFVDPDFTPSPALRENVITQLVVAYGSVEKASSHYFDIITEAARAGR